MRGGDIAGTSAAGTRRPTEAACAYWRRRGLATEPEQVLLAPSGAVALLAVLGAVGPGGVLLPRPSGEGVAPQARSLGRSLRTVPVPAECGGAPDPFALQEAVRRERADGGDPRVLSLSVADELTGTAVPPELLHEVCEVAAAEGLLIVSDESWRDTSHGSHDTVIVSPVEMQEKAVGGSLGGETVVMVDVAAELLPAGPAATAVRFAPTSYGRTLREAAVRVLGTLGASLSEDARQAVTVALSEPESLRTERQARVRRHAAYAAALYEALHDVGAHSRPPRLGRGLYADLEPLRGLLAARGVTDSLTLEAELTLAVGPWACGGHRFGDHPAKLRVWLGTGMLALPGPTVPETSTVLDAAARRTLDRLTSVLSGASRDLEGML